jgi:hypothetical protein
MPVPLRFMLSNNLPEYGKFAHFFYFFPACANKPRPLLSSKTAVKALG